MPFDELTINPYWPFYCTVDEIYVYRLPDGKLWEFVDKQPQYGDPIVIKYMPTMRRVE